MTQEEIIKAFEGRWRIKGKYIEDGIILFNSKEGVAEAIKKLCRDFFEAGIALGNDDYSVQMENPIPSVQELKPIEEALKDKKLNDRSFNFQQTVFNAANIKKYGMTMLQDFCDYWTEPNPSQTKMRFELQKTWDVNRRLARWARNNFNRYDRQQPVIEQQRRDKLADILTD